jgi:hypothetical protein
MPEAWMSYGESDLVRARRIACYVGRILQGARPRDLPVEQSTYLELAINLKTAKALGLTVPPPVLLRADRVIEWLDHLEEVGAEGMAAGEAGASESATIPPPLGPRPTPDPARDGDAPADRTRRLVELR